MDCFHQAIVPIRQIVFEVIYEVQGLSLYGVLQLPGEAREAGLDPLGTWALDWGSAGSVEPPCSSPQTAT